MPAIKACEPSFCRVGTALYGAEKTPSHSRIFFVAVQVANSCL